MTLNADNTPSLLVTCVGASECTLIVEPWGTEYHLAAGDWIKVVTQAIAKDACEVSYSPGAILVGITTNDPVQIYHSSQGELSL
jgi:hypothetical protein